MSSDDDFDATAYKTFEDQLYEEQSSSGSDDDLDSEVEEALYSQVHYASSLLISENFTQGEKTPKTRNLVDKSLDAQGQKCQLDSSVIVISSDDEDDDKDVKNDDYTDNHDDVDLSSSMNYPEVVKIFADNNNLTSNEATDKESPFAQSEVKPGKVAENWNLNEKDLGLEDSKTTKQRQRYYAPGKGLPNVRCYNCNEKGHLSQNCPEPKKISVCFLCGGVGHMKRFCPNELCFNCYEPGHMSKQCRKPRRRPFDRCGRCHVLGHLANDCPDRWRQYHLTIQDGPIIRPAKPVSPSRPVYCYNCGDQGHYGHECQEENESRRHELPLPFVVNYNACQMTASRQKKKFDKRTPERRSNNERQNQTQRFNERESRQQDDDHNNGSYQPLPNNKRRNQVSSQGFFAHQSRQQDYDDDKSSCPSLRNNKRRNQVSSQGFNDRQSRQQDYDDDNGSYQSPRNNKRQNKIQGFYDHWSIQQGLDMDNNSYQPPLSNERRNQASSQRFNDLQFRQQEYDMDNSSYQPPPEKIRRINFDDDDDDLRRVLLQSDSYKTDEYNSQYTDRILPKRNKKKNKKEQTARGDERIVEILDPSPPDDGLIEEPYQPKKKKAKKRGKQHWQERDKFNDNFNSNNFNARNNSNHRNEMRFSNPNRNKDNRSFDEREYDSTRTSFNPKKRRKDFVSDRGFRFNNEPRSKKSNPQFWKRYTF